METAWAGGGKGRVCVRVGGVGVCVCARVCVYTRNYATFLCRFHDYRALLNTKDLHTHIQVGTGTEQTHAHANTHTHTHTLTHTHTV